MGPIKHLIFSTVLGGSLLIVNKDPKAAMASVVAGTMVDLDHLIEYRKYCRDADCEWDWEQFLSGVYFNDKKTVQVMFHSWEAAIIMWLCIFLTGKRNGIFLGIACGYVLHLIWIKSAMI